MGRTPLLLATQAGLREVVELLLEYKARPETVDNEGYAAIHYAAEAGFSELCHLLAAESTALAVSLSLLAFLTSDCCSAASARGDGRDSAAPRPRGWPRPHGAAAALPV